MKKLFSRLLVLSLFTFLIMSMITYNVNAQVKKNVKKDIVSESPVKADNIVNNQTPSPLLSPYPSINCYPKSLPQTTGSVLSDGTISQTSLIRCFGDDGSGSGEQGWMKFDLSSIPGGSYIVSVVLHFYVDSTFAPYFYVNQVTSDPETAAGSTLYSEITGDVGRYYSYVGSQVKGWNVLTLNATANADVASLLAQQWWAIGLYENDGTPAYYFWADGWNETNKPYITVTYSATAVFDVQTMSTWMPSKIPMITASPLVVQNLPFKAKIVNNGTQAATFNDNLRIYKNGVTDALYVTPFTNMLSGAISTLSGNYSVTSLANYNLSNTTLLSGDGTPANDSIYYRLTCAVDTVFAWDKGTPSSSVAYTGGIGYYGSVFTLSAQDTLTSATICAGSLTATPSTGISIEIWNTSSGVPTTLRNTVASSISLAATDNWTYKTYMSSSPIVLPAGTYFLALHSPNAVTGNYPLAYDGGTPAYTSTTVPRGVSYLSSAGTIWTELPAAGAFYGMYITRANFATVIPAFPNDVGAFSIEVPANNNPGTVSPKATVKNFGTAAQTFDVNMTITGGYSSTKPVTALAPGATIQVTFDDWSAVLNPNVTVNVCTQLAGDANTANDCMSSVVGVYTGSYSTGTNIPTAGGTYNGGGVGYTEIIDKAITGYFFSIGGNTTSTLGTECYKYNVNTGIWTTIASLPLKRLIFGTALVDHYIYVIGGSDGVTYQTSVYKYDINNDAGGWVAVASLPMTIGWCKAVGYNNHIYLAGGYDGTANVLSSVYVYDVAADTWTAGTSMPAPRFGGGFGITGNTLVYVAGVDLSVFYNTVFRGTIDGGNPLNITWTSAARPYPGNGIQYADNSVISDLISGTLQNTNGNKIKINNSNSPNSTYPPGALYKFNAAPWGSDAIIVAGGAPTSAYTPAVPNPCYAYKPATDTWIKQGDVPVPVVAAQLGSVYNGSDWKLIVSGGLTTGSLSTYATQIWSDNLASPLNLGLTAMLSGYCNGTTMNYTKSVTVELHAATTPYGLIESKVVTLDANGAGNPVYTTAVNGTPYYIVIRTDNGLETWSATAQMFSGSTLTYDFTSAATQVYGSNEQLVGTKYCIISGDANQDGAVDALDRSACWNDRNLTGVYATDLDGNGTVDALDRSIAWNNRNLAVAKPALVSIPNGRQVKQDNGNIKGTYDLRLDGSNAKKVTKNK